VESMEVETLGRIVEEEEALIWGMRGMEEGATEASDVADNVTLYTWSGSCRLGES